MKKASFTCLVVVVLSSCALFTYCHFRSPTDASRHVLAGWESGDGKSGPTAYNDRAAARAKSRHKESGNSKLAEFEGQAVTVWIDDDGRLDRKVLESHGLGEKQIDAMTEVFHEISEDISEYFTSNCKEELTADGSYIYVLNGNADLALALQDKMRARLAEAIGSGASGFKLANRITEQVKGQALLNYGADDMIAAAFRGFDENGIWEDGMLINGRTPGMIDYYRKNGWPHGDDIHTSNGQAIFHPIKKPH